MNKKLKRETKMAIFTYGTIATIYIAILYIFSIVSLNNTLEIGELFDIKVAILMVFVFVACVIGVYKGTKAIKSDYIRGIAIFLIPTIIVLLFKDEIAMAVILMLMYFMVRGIYNITPKPNKILMKVLKLVLIVIIVCALILSIGLLIGKLTNGMSYNSEFFQIAGETSNYEPNIYNHNGFLELQNKDIFVFSMLLTFEKNIALMIAALLFISFATKEIIKKILVKYKPTDREIGSLISGTVVLFFVMIGITSLIQYTYKSNMSEREVKELGEFNYSIKNILLDNSINKDVKELKINSEIKNLNEIAYTYVYKGSTTSFVYIIDISKILIEYNVETNTVTDTSILQSINNKYGEKFDQLEPRIMENYIKQQNVMYDIMLGLFALFILIEIYEEIRIIQMLKKKEKVKIEEK